MSLTGCIKKAGPALSAENKTAILLRAKELRAEGKSAEEAAMLAVDERIEAVTALLSGAKTQAPQPTANITAAKPPAAAPTVAPAPKPVSERRAAEEPTVELRKRLSVLNALKECIG